MRERPLNRIAKGKYLVTDSSGWTRYNTDVVVGKYGAQAGQLVARDEVDKPGRSDLNQMSGRERLLPGRRTGPAPQNWRYRDKDGNLV